MGMSAVALDGMLEKWRFSMAMECSGVSPVYTGQYLLHTKAEELNPLMNIVIANCRWSKE